MSKPKESEPYECKAFNTNTSMHASVALLFNCIIMRVCKHGEESGRTIDKSVKRSLNCCGLTQHTNIHSYGCDDSNRIF